VNHQSFIQIKEIRPKCIHAWDNIEKALEASQVACFAKDPAGIRNRKACNRHATSACTTPYIYIYIYISSELGNSHPATTLIDDQLQNSLDLQVGEQLQI
jgi:hypothetical protein